MRFPKKALSAVLVGGALLMSASAVFAYGDGGGYSGNWGGNNFGQDRPTRAVSYINPDTGAATANPDVDPNSSCFRPDRYDTQVLSNAGMTNNNVHNDACFFSWGSNVKLDAPATFESRGVGSISACPDPDNAGPKIAVLRDVNGDGRNDFCFQSGYQEKGIAGDKEFHARMNNTNMPGLQTVTWCYDKNQNGCSDEYVKDKIQINWVR